VLDYAEYTTGGNGYQGNGNGFHPNGYDHLNGDWAVFYKVAKGFLRRVKPDDRQDFLHDLFLTMAKVKAKYQLIGKPLTEGGLVRIAAFAVAQYWRDYYQKTRGVDCGRCSDSQRAECKEKDLYRECPKAVKMESLDKLIEDGEGDHTELYQMIADDNAVDVVAMLDAKFTIQGYPHKLVRIAYKKYAGYPLITSERNYLYQHRRKALQKSFSLV
jgi:hypothetical protein